MKHLTAMPRWGRVGIAGAAGALLTAGLVVALQAAPAAAATGGSGASLPYTEVQAENASTTGTVIGPSYTQGQLADEASYRKAVTLTSGQYVQFTTPVATNSIVVRYSIPDGSGGSVYTAPLSFYINGSKQTDLTLTDAYSWYYGSYPFVNTPGSNPHHFYDEVHRLFSTTYPAGTTFKVQVDAGNNASSYTIDFADFEQVGNALTQPSGSVSVTSYGADTSGTNDATSAFNQAIAAAGSGGTVWIPTGSYKIPGHIAVNNVTLAGAGMWYSTIVGAAPGFYGNSAPNASTNVHLQNFAISGDVQQRDDNAQVNGIGGAMSNSSVTSVWIEHMKVGAWMDGPMTSLTLSGLRIRDITADGINYHGSVTNSTVTNSDIRNTGDDGIATWSESLIGADTGDTISNNTVQLQILANGIAIYGGNNNTVTGNLVVDSGISQGGGIHVGQRFTSTTLGLTTISNNTMIRDGDLDPNWQFGVGALWFDASQGAITGPINVTNALIQQSPFEAIQWVEGTISGVNLNNVTISGAGTFALQEQTGGTASATNVVATGVAQSSAPSYSCEGGNFTITDGGGNSGITPTQCNGWPTPVYPGYPTGGGGGGSSSTTSPSGPTLSTNPASLAFGSIVVGSSSASQSTTITNTGGSTATISSVTVTGDFSRTTTCGSTLAANASCTVTVTFTPTATGNRTGTLTVTSNASNNPTTVALSGTGATATTNLAAGKATSESSHNDVYPSSNVTDSNQNTYWESANNAFPQWVQVDLGSAQTIGSVAVQLPSTWEARTQTFSVQGSTNGSSFSTIVNSAAHTFSPTANTVTLTFTATSARYVRLNVTANTGWPAAQVSELQVFAGSGGGGGGGSATLAASPTTLTFGNTTVGSTSSAQTVTISNSGSAAATVSSVAVTGDYAQTNTCGSSIAANGSCTVSVTFHPTATGTRTGTLTVTSNATNSPTTVALTGTATSSSTNLAAGKSTSESSHNDVYPSSNVTDGNQSTYWESANNAFPQWVQVDLGSAQTVGRVVVQLPSTWEARTQTFSVQGSTNGSSFSTIVNSAGYTFSPSGNTVTITFTGTSTRYLRLNVTANTGWPAAQVSELQVYSS